MSTPSDLHVYVSFDDPDEQRTWVFDATFLRSKWTCIWGNGCKGVLPTDATHLNHGCCSHGAHFIDEQDLQTVTQAVEMLAQNEWEHASNEWFDRDAEGTVTTKLVGNTCIFHNSNDYLGGQGCALHNAAVRRAERPMDWKPDVCWQLPLRLYDEVDTYGHVTSTLREWKRRDWGEGGDDFHWWCTETSEAFIGASSVLQSMRDEIIEFTGLNVYEMLAATLGAPEDVSVAHPAVRHRS